MPNLRHARLQSQAAFTAVPIAFYLFFPTTFSPYCAAHVCIYTHIYCVQPAYELPLLPNNTAVKYFHTNRSVANCRLYTGLFVIPSGISELDCATTKTDTAERSISICRESLQIFFVLGALDYFQAPPLGGSRDEKWR